MAFEFLRAENNAAPIEKELPAKAGDAFAHGETVAFSSGVLAKVSGANAPEFVYVGKDIASAVTGQIINVVPVLPEYEWETTFSANASSVKAGTKVQISSDGTQATATSGGKFQLLADGAAKDAKGVGRFVS